MIIAACLITLIFIFKFSNYRQIFFNLSLQSHIRYAKQEQASNCSQLTKEATKVVLCNKLNNDTLQNKSIKVNLNNQFTAHMPYSRRIVILLWTTFLGDVTWQRNTGVRTLSHNKTCEFTSDKNLLSFADYVFFKL